MNQIYFTADLHFGHANILKHSPKRPHSETVDIATHDEWLLDLWKSTVDKRDIIYILGDLTFLKAKMRDICWKNCLDKNFLSRGITTGRFGLIKPISKRCIRLKKCALSQRSLLL